MRGRDKHRKHRLHVEGMEKVILRLAQIGMPVEMATRLLRADGDERGLLSCGCKLRPVLGGSR